MTTTDTQSPGPVNSTNGFKKCLPMCPTTFGSIELP